MNNNSEVNFDTENLCLHCGRCCHRKEILNGKVVFTKDECPNLVNDGHGKYSCKIYDRRLQTIITIAGHDVRCISAEEAYRQGALPKDCPYVYYYTHGMDKKLKSFLTFQECCETQDWTMVYPRPQKNCKRCYGRGYIGRNIHSNAYVPCSCLK